MKNEILKFKAGNETLVFTQIDNSDKYTFSIKGQPELTKRVLEMTNVHKIKRMDIEKYAIPALRRLVVQLQDKEEIHTYSKDSNENAVIELGVLVQKMFGANIETIVESVTGPSHSPEVTCRIYLPFGGESFTGTGRNKKLAKQVAAEKALNFIRALK